MKKFLAILAACMTITTAFVSCGDKDDDKKSSSKSGSDKAANDYADALFSKKGGETYYTLIYPDEYIEELKDDDAWEYNVEYFNDRNEERTESHKFTVKNVKKSDKLTDDQLLGAGFYFDDYFDIDDIEVDEGYEYTYEIEMTDKNDKENKNSLDDTICVVKIGKDWKIITTDADSLEDYV